MHVVEHEGVKLKGRDLRPYRGCRFAPCGVRYRHRRHQRRKDCDAITTRQPGFPFASGPGINRSCGNAS